MSREDKDWDSAHEKKSIFAFTIPLNQAASMWTYLCLPPESEKVQISATFLDLRTPQTMEPLSLNAT